MKKILYLNILLFLQGCFYSQNKQYDLPAFNLLLSDSITVFNTKNIPKGKPSILIFFSPDCEHCQAETESILNNIDSLMNVQLYFITIDPMDRMKVFIGFYKLNQYSNIIVGKDLSYFLPSHFKGIAPPCSIIYDSENKMRAILKGQATSTKLISIINDL